MSKTCPFVITSNNSRVACDPNCMMWKQDENGCAFTIGLGELKVLEKRMQIAEQNTGAILQELRNRPAQ